MSKHVAIWIDQNEAHVFAISFGVANELTIAAPHDLRHKHPRMPKGVKSHPNDAKRFFGEVLRSLAGVEQLLLVGPSAAKLEFLKYLQAHDHAFGPEVIGVETVFRPTDGQLISYAQKYFARPTVARLSALAGAFKCT